MKNDIELLAEAYDTIHEPKIIINTYLNGEGNEYFNIMFPALEAKHEPRHLIVHDKQTAIDLSNKWLKNNITHKTDNEHLIKFHDINETRKLRYGF